MRYRLSTISIGLVLGLLLAAPFPAAAAPTDANNLKVAYVNIQKVLQSYDKYQQAMEELQQYQSKLEEKMNAEKQELSQLRSEMQEGQFLSSEEQQKKRQEFQQKMQALRQRAQRSQQLVQQKRRELMAPIFDTATDAVARTGNELGYDAIYRFDPSRDGSILWIHEKVNLTEQVIERLQNMTADASE